jgi:hypothetical protein
MYLPWNMKATILTKRLFSLLVKNGKSLKALKMRISRTYQICILIFSTTGTSIRIPMPWIWVVAQGGGQR